MFAGTKGTWRRGEPVRLVRSGGDYAIRIDSNMVMRDNLGTLPDIEDGGAAA